MRIIGGALGGVVGSVLMAVPMLAARAAGLLRKPPPEQITEGLLERAGIQLDRQTEDRLAAFFHLGFGAGAGALYGALVPTRDVPRPVALGLGYATVIYLVSYGGWVPALGLMPRADKDDPARQLVMLLAHWMYGTTIALATVAASRGDVPSTSEPRIA
ncbi:MAG: hypothetical protein ABIZ34_09220 [Candidatus Limnocylindrales bacterium]